MIRLIYTLLLAIVAPFLMFGLLRHKANKPTFGKRWKELFGVTPALKKSKGPVIWIHAVSVGEVIAVTPFIKHLANSHPDKTIVLTTTTPTGAEQAHKLGSVVEHRYMPIDFPLFIKKFITVIRPNHLIIMETELWPNTLYISKQLDISITVINARMSQKSWKLYNRVPNIKNLIFSNLDLVLCHSKSDAKRFIALGVDKAKLLATGSMKFDIEIKRRDLESSTLLKAGLNTRLVWVAASTHSNEEEIILSCHQKLLESHPDLLLILVPRHPERFDSVHSLCVNSGLTTLRRSQAVDILEDVQVYLADTMGEMLTMLGASDLCFMGGSLLANKVGGHNVLEPAAMHTPCLIGPSYYNFKDIVEEMEQSGALKVITKEDLFFEVNALLSDHSKRADMSKRSIKVVEHNKGAIKKSTMMWSETFNV